MIYCSPFLNKQFGICGKALEWFSSYLRPRYFKVKIGKDYSTPAIHFSVPQGSCSGANVFTCYCSLIDQIVPKDIKLNGFANDHSFRKSFPAGNRTQEQQAKLRMEHTFSNIKECMDSMHLKLNSEKTEYIMFGSCQQLTKINLEPLHAGPDLIELSNKVKYLGGLLDNTLSFDLYVSSKVQKATANFIKIKSIHKYITQEACTTLLLMLCMSHLDYLNAELYGIPDKTLNKYQRIQNMSAKLARGKSKYDSSIESLKTLHWLPIHQQIEFKILVLSHKCINNSAPRYLQELISVKQQKRENRRSNSMGVLLNIPTVRQTIFAARSFRHVAPTLWNRLPTNIRCTNNLDKFKGLLKTNLFSSGILLNTSKPQITKCYNVCKVHVTTTVMCGSCIMLYQMLHYYYYYVTVALHSIGSIILHEFHN